MADTKISALTAASTPLAGTEVLPIVQSGATKKVAVSDLTAGRAISATTVTSTVRSRIATVGAIGLGNDVAVGGTAADLGIGTYGTTGDIVIATGVGYTTRLRIGDSGDITASTGNLIIGTSGKGIEFSGNGSVLWRCGAGTPEGAVTAPVGSLFTRTNGGANTTLYVKESGSGNTGWVAK